MNVGASSITDYGNYYHYGKGILTAQEIEISGDSKYNGTENPLSASVDTATQVWGNDWHMPTQAQFNELIANTTYQWVTNYKGSNIDGGIFTANGQMLFIPAAGSYFDGSVYSLNVVSYVWSSTPSGSNAAYLLNLNNGGRSI